ncbi:hypothetical protein KIPB_012441, partial [Kipferlia bialata]|eukprot:g12441.t1
MCPDPDPTASGRDVAGLPGPPTVRGVQSSRVQTVAGQSVREGDCMTSVRDGPRRQEAESRRIRPLTLREASGLATRNARPLFSPRRRVLTSINVPEGNFVSLDLDLSDRVSVRGRERERDRERDESGLRWDLALLGRLTRETDTSRPRPSPQHREAERARERGLFKGGEGEKDGEGEIESESMRVVGMELAEAWRRDRVRREVSRPYSQSSTQTSLSHTQRPHSPSAPSLSHLTLLGRIFASHSSLSGPDMRDVSRALLGEGERERERDRERPPSPKAVFPGVRQYASDHHIGQDRPSAFGPCVLPHSGSRQPPPPIAVPLSPANAATVVCLVQQYLGVYAEYSCACFEDYKK